MEQKRAEGNLDLALQALDAVYLEAIGTEKFLGIPISRPEQGDFGLSPSARAPLTDLEKELLKRGLLLYDQFALENVATHRAAAKTAQAHYRVGLLQAALEDHQAAACLLRAIERFQRLIREDSDNVSYHRSLAASYRGLGGILTEWTAAKQAFLESHRAWSKVIALQPNQSEWYLQRATVSELFGDGQLCLEDLETGLELDPHNVAILRKCAREYRWTRFRSCAMPANRLNSQSVPWRWCPMILSHMCNSPKPQNTSVTKSSR